MVCPLFPYAGRSAAAAEFHFFCPEHLLVDKLQPCRVPNLYFYYTTEKDANYRVNIDSTFEKKIEAVIHGPLAHPRA